MPRSKGSSEKEMPAAGAVNEAAMTVESLTRQHGQPTITTPSFIERRGVTRSVGRRAPVVVADAELEFGCGLRAKLGFGGYTVTKNCNGHEGDLKTHT